MTWSELRRSLCRESKSNWKRAPDWCHRGRGGWRYTRYHRRACSGDHISKKVYFIPYIRSQKLSNTWSLSRMRKVWGRYGDFIKQYKSPSSKCYVIFWSITLYSEIIHWSDLTLMHGIVTKMDFSTTINLFTLFREVFNRTCAHVQRIWHAERRSLLLRTPGRVQFRTCFNSSFESSLFDNLSFSRLFILIILR